MAINSSDHVENSQVQASVVTSPKEADLVSNHVSVQKSIKSASSANSKRPKAKNSGIAAYYDGLQLFSRRKREEKNTTTLSSIQLASNIYKSNSDEFKLKKKLFKKSNKKSVLTLPNEECVKPHAVTVSDINDSEYFYRNKKPKVQKAKKLKQKNKYHASANKGFEYYDKEARFCSQVNVYLDCSSTDLVKNFKGDGKRKQRCDTEDKDLDLAPHNVWAVLRDINKFRFQPSPPMSDNSIVSLKKNRFRKKKFDNCVYETRRTEQIAYISSIDHNGDSQTVSASSSIDRITIIDNVEVVKKIREPPSDIMDKKLGSQIKSRNNRKPIENQQLNNSKRISRNDCKALSFLNKLTERKMNDSTNVEQMQCSSINQTDANEELLVEPKSKISLKARETLNKFDRLNDLSNRTEVEIQTEKNIPVKMETDKFQINTGNAVDTTKSSRRLTPIKSIRHERFNTKKGPEQPSLPPRTASNTQPSSNTALTYPLITNNEQTTLNPGNGFKFSNSEDTSRTPFPDTTLSNANQVQRLTQSGIRRAIARIKFPLVILGKDQLSSGTFEIEDYDFPQFNGLDKQVWPFMRNWSDTINKLHEPDVRNMQPAGQFDRNTKYNPTNKITVHLPNNKTNIARKPNLTDIKPYINKSIQEHKKNKLESEVVKPVPKLRPIQQFRDRMLRLLYKKPSNTSSNVKDTPVLNDTKKVTVVKSSNNDIGLKKSLPERMKSPQTSLLPPPTSPSKLLIPQQSQPSKSKQNWNKAKQTSDFIENIIKKVRSGYYTAELECENSNTEPDSNCTSDDTLNLPVNDSKEISTEVIIPTTSEDFMPKITIQKKKEPLVMLPGFDDSLPKLEIKSMTRNQIAVRHCVTNLTLQFDIDGTTVESKCIDATFKSSIVCIPLSVTESKTKVYKCKTRILNAMLPAELCSILPKVMKQCQDNYLRQTLQEKNKILPCLHSIAECTVPQNQVVSKTSLLPHIEPLQYSRYGYVSSKLRNLINGRFSKSPTSWTENTHLSSKENNYVIILSENCYHHVKDMLAQVRISYHYPDYISVQVDQQLLRNSPISKRAVIFTNQDYAPQPINLCRDLVPYVKNEIVHNQYHAQNTLQIMFQNILNMMREGKINSIIRYCPSQRIQTLNYPITENQFTNLGSKTSVYISVANIRIDSQPNASVTNCQTTIANSTKHTEQCERKEFVALKQNPIRNAVPSKYNRNKTHAKYAKLYKKYKSTSRTTAKRSCTPLCNVTNMDEFCRALGAGNMLASAFDGGCWNKILSCIIELKNWTMTITPSQALMVMLLTNKKETRKLARFRPIILQGIAFNRITRVSELDMEIEVIEREILNLPEFSNGNCLIENTQEYNILEELCWIAKTTASDYQKPFDESSEALLKALLNKRKKLNTSYLRVMARYVGLGLLKTATH